MGVSIPAYILSKVQNGTMTREDAQKLALMGTTGNAQRASEIVRQLAIRDNVQVDIPPPSNTVPGISPQSAGANFQANAGGQVPSGTSQLGSTDPTNTDASTAAQSTSQPSGNQPQTVADANGATGPSSAASAASGDPMQKLASAEPGTYSREKPNGVLVEKDASGAVKATATGSMGKVTLELPASGDPTASGQTSAPPTGDPTVSGQPAAPQSTGEPNTSGQSAAPSAGEPKVTVDGQEPKDSNAKQAAMSFIQDAIGKNVNDGMKVSGGSDSSAPTPATSEGDQTGGTPLGSINDTGASGTGQIPTSGTQSLPSETNT